MPPCNARARGKRYQPALERLEDRLAPATSISVIPGAAGAGSLDGFLSLARVLEARGEMEGALRLIQQAEQIGRDFHFARLSASQAKLWLAQGNVPAVTEWAAALQREHARH